MTTQFFEQCLVSWIETRDHVFSHRAQINLELGPGLKLDPVISKKSTLSREEIKRDLTSPELSHWWTKITELGNRIWNIQIFLRICRIYKVWSQCFDSSGEVSTCWRSWKVYVVQNEGEGEELTHHKNIHQLRKTYMKCQSRDFPTKNLGNSHRRQYCEHNERWFFFSTIFRPIKYEKVK